MPDPSRPAFRRPVLALALLPLAWIAPVASARPGIDCDQPPLVLDAGVIDAACPQWGAATAMGASGSPETGGYNSDYLFGFSRGLAASTLRPALKPILFIVTVPLDIALFPFALIGGLFG